MQRCLAVVLVICGVLPSCLTASGEKVVIVYKDSFETPSPAHPEIPDGWQLFDTPFPLKGGTIKLDAGRAQDGKKALALSSNGSKVELATRSPVPLKSNQGLKIRLWSRSELKRGRATLTVFWFDKVLRPIGSQPLELPVEVNTWVENTFLVNSPAAAVRFGFHLELNATGRIWIDGLTVSQTIAPPVRHLRQPAAVASGKAPMPTAQPAPARPEPATRPGPSLQLRLDPSTARLVPGQSLAVHALVSHTRNQPTRIHVNITLFRGPENKKPLGTKVYLITVRPKQTVSLNYLLETAGLSPGNYRLVGLAEAPDETGRAVLPVELLPPEKNRSTTSQPAQKK